MIRSQVVSQDRLTFTPGTDMCFKCDWCDHLWSIFVKGRVSDFKSTYISLYLSMSLHVHVTHTEKMYSIQWMVLRCSLGHISIYITNAVSNVVSKQLRTRFEWSDYNGHSLQLWSHHPRWMFIPSVNGTYVIHTVKSVGETSPIKGAHNNISYNGSSTKIHLFRKLSYKQKLMCF